MLRACRSCQLLSELSHCDTHVLALLDAQRWQLGEPLMGKFELTRCRLYVLLTQRSCKRLGESGLLLTRLSLGSAQQTFVGRGEQTLLHR